MAQRGFQIVSAYQHEGLNLPKRSTLSSAGYDLEAAVSAVIPPKNFTVIPTGLKAYMEPDEVLLIYSRSSLFEKKRLILTNSVGVIDHDYYDNPDNEGHIRIMLYNLGDLPAVISKGERLVQAVFTKFLIADNDRKTGKIRTGGFGSTGS